MPLTNEERREIRFNSLRTGKPIQSCWHSYFTLGPLRKSFNSLRTGKPIQSKTQIGGIS